MAALVPTFKSRLFELNGRVMQTFRVAITATSSATEWIDTDLGWIESVVGWAHTGTAPPTQTTAEAVQTPVFVLNAQGTGVTAGTNPGDLGLEGATAVDMTIDVTVIGLLQL